MMDEQVCEKCGMLQGDWSDTIGYAKSGAVYCCAGCAEGPGCTCVEADVPPDPAPTKEDIRYDPASARFVSSLQQQRKTMSPDDYGADAIAKTRSRDGSPD